MTPEFRSQVRDGVKYFIWMCGLTVLVAIFVAAILYPHDDQPTSQLQINQSVASVIQHVQSDLG